MIKFEYIVYEEIYRSDMFDDVQEGRGRVTIATEAGKKFNKDHDKPRFLLYSDALEFLGEEGFELCSVIHMMTPNPVYRMMRYFFKRQVQQ